ncbi:DUF1272 domain-containing protein [Patiriisocius hiemis]|uniref:DUF1272 domain-containing protein n=1 Tax=Patiriisocius hiemis TaxID=3075604 RepID=A0ABU2YDX0_9FLAO|nr:DUF1272 domain-containing protein [Constantimarinum sp. W242]MDT0556388.1 DUF1272 domain-containing protein [Constantimarinum sp. W242]
MLQLRPTCENCNRSLPPESTEAYICSYECTFCASCVENVLHNVCPNCGGGFQQRPIRPKDELMRNPSSTNIVYKPINQEKFKVLLGKNKDVLPEER